MKTLKTITLSAVFFISATSLYGASREVCALGSCVEETGYTRIGVIGGYGSLQPDSTQSLAMVNVINRSVASSQQRESMQSIFALKVGRVSRSSARFGAFDTRDNADFMANGRVGLGINLAPSGLSPLYLNALYIFEILTDTQKLHIGSVELQGFIRASSKVRYEYTLGYEYVFSGAYILPKLPSAKMDSGYGLRASLGASYTLNNRLHTYCNIYGTYRRLGEADIVHIASIQPTQQYIGGVELGVGF